MLSDGLSDDVVCKLKTVVDKQEIHDVLTRYCHGADRNDIELMFSAFHDDAIVHFDVDELAYERFQKTHRQSTSKWTMQSISNILIQVDGDVAHSQSYLVARHRFDHEGGEIDWIVGGRYLDRHERRDGEWRIAHRAVLTDWDRIDPVVPKPTGLGISGFFERVPHGSRSRDDLSYETLRF